MATRGRPRTRTEESRAEYLRNYRREWFKRRRDEWFAGKCCVICGSTDRLEADHIDPSTKDPQLKKGTSLWSWSDKRREAELAKCQVLCHEHHLAKTTV